VEYAEAVAGSDDSNVRRRFAPLAESTPHTPTA